ncbi:nicotinate-nucleotide--dimethylbenzimidazole phosphoribosyltransferase [Mesobaculum littorinae]|uniref:Nicotinate-nucleotide--dimethylbenzimidazole phosphoribosyltransferase n=1 Tax=Mesobaculum littorinae TaxID=2486419 RepID=A0A438AMC4_9RHOB|nr:nicotinate-nucleotide--dimethylbenzimidazole phosphoribosyltransferase [Mesobaculum littorinae]RVV99804.1 nicotinate-nucleotide--dimethylbenzimidazole phosphoribosyltransferase [Mesobaculum littorinae]
MTTAEVQSIADIRARLTDLPQPDGSAIAAARARNGMLTKPPGALGRLEDLAIWYAGWRGDARPDCTTPLALVFAGNHGIAARGVSAFPPEVTAQMVANFQAGGAAINQLCRAMGARIAVHALDLDTPTADFTAGPAMDEAGLVRAVRAGWDAVDTDADCLIAGEMGIGNTASAAAIAGALYGGDWVGPGTGVAGDALEAKRRLVAEGIAAHRAVLSDPIEVLRCLGGREIAAMAGAILRARHLRIPVILDGFICTAAAAVLEVAAPGALDHCVAGHGSAETAHARLLDRLDKAPLLSLGLRLGEGTGGVLALGVLKGALACHSGMATFDEAGVAGG